MKTYKELEDERIELSITLKNLEEYMYSYISSALNHADKRQLMLVPESEIKTIRNQLTRVKTKIHRRILILKTKLKMVRKKQEYLQFVEKKRKEKK